MDIISDVLEPLGLPLVGVYCKIKEDTFLNTSDVDAKGFEAVGNWFLTPARYLFNGKKVTQLNFAAKSCQLENQHTYGASVSKEILQTVLSIILLAPSMILGSIFKGISFISKETRRRHSIIRDANEKLKNIPHLIAENNKNYNQAGIKTTAEGEFFNPNPAKKPMLSDPLVPSAIKKTLRKQKIDIKRLAELGKILTEAGIVWWVDFGTCLGVYRHNGMIPWDLDIDLAILAPDHDTVKHLLLSKLPKDKFDVWDFSPGTKPKSLIKIRFKETNMLVDIYHYTIDADKSEKTHGDGEKAPKITYEFSHLNEWWMPEEAKKREPTHSYIPDTVFPLKKAKFDGVDVFVPNKLDDYLLEKYSRSPESKDKPKEDRLIDLEPCRVWNPSTKTYDKVPDHPYFKQSALNT